MHAARQEITGGHDGPRGGGSHQILSEFGLQPERHAPAHPPWDNCSVGPATLCLMRPIRLVAYIRFRLRNGPRSLTTRRSDKQPLFWGLGRGAPTFRRMYANPPSNSAQVEDGVGNSSSASYMCI